MRKVILPFKRNGTQMPSGQVDIIRKHFVAILEDVLSHAGIQSKDANLYTNGTKDKIDSQIHDVLDNDNTTEEVGQEINLVRQHFALILQDLLTTGKKSESIDDYIKMIMKQRVGKGPLHFMEGREVVTGTTKGSRLSPAYPPPSLRVVTAASAVTTEL